MASRWSRQGFIVSLNSVPSAVEGIQDRVASSLQRCPPWTFFTGHKALFIDVKSILEAVARSSHCTCIRPQSEVIRAVPWRDSACLRPGLQPLHLIDLGGDRCLLGPALRRESEE